MIAGAQNGEAGCGGAVRIMLRRDERGRIFTDPAGLLGPGGKGDDLGG